RTRPTRCRRSRAVPTCRSPAPPDVAPCVGYRLLANSMQDRKPRTRARREAPTQKGTAARILDAAEARFAAKGYDATSLGDVADDVKIRAPSLYKHFAGKRELYVAVMQRLLDPYFALLHDLLVVPREAEDAARNV